MARTHGLLSTYRNGGCRCGDCRWAAAEAQRRWRAAHRVTPQPQPWQRPDRYDQAACRGMDPDLFFPARGDTQAVNEAKATCAGCDVRALCAEAGHGEHFGIWGGLSERQRRRKRTA